MCAALTSNGPLYSRTAVSLAVTPANSDRFSIMVKAVCGSTSVATGTAWYVEPFQHTGGLGAPSVPHGRSRSEIDSGVMSKIFASRVITSSPSLACCLSSCRSIVTTIDVRFDTSGRPAWSKINPRTAGSTTSRTVLLMAAERYSSPSMTCR